MGKLFNNSLAVAFCFMLLCKCTTVSAQKFIHPGINQSNADLAYMKRLVQDSTQPWKSAFDRLRKETDLSFVPHPYSHVLRGPYDKPDIGGKELSKSANIAYNCALLWYITGKKAYANKAIQIINAWSNILWDFDYNDAKLLAAWTGHVFCNAAEILRYTSSGWKQQDIGRFSDMLMSVYFPLLRYYFPTANGNWDGAIGHTLMAIAIFTDNRSLFNHAVDHFLHGPVNGSLFKYIYPNGECQESPRDQGHVQLGEGEFAGAAQVAYTQGVDLFSIGNYRIAKGLEYTAEFLLGKTPYCYCEISPRGKKLSDNYEYVYRQYTAMGIKIPYIKEAAERIRPNVSRSILTSVRASFKTLRAVSKNLPPDTIAYIAGAGYKQREEIPKNAVWVSTSQSIQTALDSVAGTGGWVVVAKGIHTLKASLRIPSGVTLSGEGEESVLFLSPSSGDRDALVNEAADIHDVTVRDLIIEGGLSPLTPSDPNSSRSFRNKGNRGGIIFRSEEPGKIHNLHFINLTVRNCTYNGVFISGAQHLSFIRCNFNENGAAVVPGPKLQHNLLLTHCDNIRIDESRLDTSPDGAGISLFNCAHVICKNNEIARNAEHGILIAQSSDVQINNNLIEGNNESGIMLGFLYEGSRNIIIQDNRIHFNSGYGVESYDTKQIQLKDNICKGNGTFTGTISDKNQVKISSETKVLF